MNNDGGLIPTNIAEIMDKFNQTLRKFAIKETEWLINKSNYENRISELEGHLKAHENINIDLVKRIRMLEYALSQERIKNSKLLGNSKEDEKEELRYNNNIILNEPDVHRDLLKEEDLKLIRERSIRPSLLNMLKDIGISENLANNLFTDLELNKTELERLIKNNMDEKLNQVFSNETKTIPYKTDNSDQVIATNEIYKEHNNKEIISDKIEPKNIPVLNLANSKTLELKSHFDVIRKLGYIPNLNALVSISEDCLIKVWSMKNLNFTNSSDTEPYLILRGHTGPLFSLALSPEQSDSNIIYTAGNEGIIKIWKIPRPEEVVQFGDTESIFNCSIGFFQKSTEVVWDMKHHPRQNLLVSLNSDGFINFWETTSIHDYISSFNEGKYDKWLKASKTRNTLDTLEFPIPTTCTFLNSDLNLLLTGFNDGYISIFDMNKTTFTTNIKTFKPENKEVMNRVNLQANCIICSTSVPLLYGGFEDSTIKSFDLRSYDPNISSINAHNDSVTSLTMFNDIYIFSTSHDTKVKMWDIRNLNSCVQEAIGSQKKWDEAILHSILIPNQLLLATAGADSVIKIFKL